MVKKILMLLIYILGKPLDKMAFPDQSHEFSASRYVENEVLHDFPGRIEINVLLTYGRGGHFEKSCLPAKKSTSVIIEGYDLRNSYQEYNFLAIQL